MTTCNRCVDVLVGLQAGSEGKGGVISRIAHKYKALVRTGGPNAAHVVHYKGSAVPFHQIPCGALHAPDAKLVLGAGAIIDIELLVNEIAILKSYNKWLDSDGKVRLFIDHHATIIDPIDKIAENGGRMPDCGDLYFHPLDCDIHNNELNGSCLGCTKLPKDSAWTKLGSTTHGAGANLIRKAARGTKMAILPGQKLDHSKFDSRADKLVDQHKMLDKIFNQNRWYEGIEEEPVRLAYEDTFLQQFVNETAIILNEMVDRNEPVMLEGTQGAMLSLHHSYWPKCTSRDTNASNWCTDAGISPLVVRDIYGVARTFPIRVAGDSGPLSGAEIDWDEVTEHATQSPIREWREEIRVYNESDKDPKPEYEEHIADLKKKLAKVEIVEITTATKRKRRVFLFGEDDFKKASYINRPTIFALTFVDYLDIDNYGKASWDSLSQRTRDWITTLESKMGVFFKFLSTGPKSEHSIVRKTPGELAAQVQAS